MAEPQSSKFQGQGPGIHPGHEKMDFPTGTADLRAGPDFVTGTKTEGKEYGEKILITTGLWLFDRP